MISTLEEVQRLKRVVAGDAGADAALRRAAQRSDVPFGIMLEVPAGGGCASTNYFRRCGFVSIGGSNDLIQIPDGG